MCDQKAQKSIFDDFQFLLKIGENLPKSDKKFHQHFSTV